MKNMRLISRMVKITTGMALLFVFLGSKNPETHTISGTIHNVQKDSDKKESVIRVFLLDKETFQKPYEGIRQKVIHVEEGKSSVDFNFKNVKSGNYGLRSFQDMNNNGELDRFLIIPREPWCLSWKDNKSIPPDFEDISFHVNKDIEKDLYLSD